jgi:aryl-alcohol dehydrogenase-like predicted oxidoreductase
MEQVKASGLARSIGVSNYLPEHLDWILETAQTPPSINQIEFHPYLQHGPLIDYHKQKVRKAPISKLNERQVNQKVLTPCAKQGIALSAYGPQTPVTKCPGGPVDAVLAKLTKKYAVNAGEILLRWCIEQDVVAVTTSSKEQRLSDYLRAMTFKLTPAEVKMVSSILFFVSWISRFDLLTVERYFRSTRLARRSISVRSGRTSSPRTIGGREMDDATLWFGASHGMSAFGRWMYSVRP